MRYLGRVMAGALVAATGAISSEAAELQASPPLPTLEAYNWLPNYGIVEVGGRVFLERSPNKRPAKFLEYRDLRNGPFGNVYLGYLTKDFLYSADIWAENIGYKDQRYLFDWSKAGSHYFTFEWNQTPHIQSTTAKTIFGGTPTALTVPDGVQTSLQAIVAAPTVPGVNAILNPNLSTIDLGTRRDRASAEYYWTPTEETDFRISYSNEKRTGNRPLGVLAPVNANAARDIFEVPMPINDTTQNFSATGQFSGMSFWGKKYNVAFNYAGSWYQNDYDSFTFENPFLIAPGGCAACPRVAHFTLPPDNQAHSFTTTTGIDLPYKSRYMGTFSYNMMRQDDPFLPHTVNPNFALTAGALAANPASSLNGKVNTLLMNNVLTTQLTPDLKSTLRYRYYDYENDTPLHRFTNYVQLDNQTVAGTAFPRTALPNQYKKENGGAELAWRPIKWVSTGLSYGWERYDRDRRDANVTNEHSAKVFLDATPIDWARLRASHLYSERRFDSYDVAAYVNPYYGTTGTGQSFYNRKFDMADRDRNLTKVSLDISAIPDVTITPNAGLKFDEYGTDPFTGERGLLHDRSWNAGVEVAYALSPTITLLASYTREEYDRRAVGGAAGPCCVTVTNRYESKINDYVDTITGAVNWEMIPTKLDLKLGYTYSQGLETWETLPFGASPAPVSPYPDITNRFHRFDAVAKYKVDEEVVRKMGFMGELHAKLYYIHERNQVTNWSIDSMQPYMAAVDPTTNKSIFMAWADPRYNVHLLAASLVFKW